MILSEELYLFDVARQVGEAPQTELTALLGLTDGLQVGPRLLGPLLPCIAAPALRSPRPGGARTGQRHLAGAGALTSSTRPGQTANGGSRPPHPDSRQTVTGTGRDDGNGSANNDFKITQSKRES